MSSILRSASLSPRFLCHSCSRSFARQSRRSYATSTPDVYDVVCVGGGPAGLSLLAALRSNFVTSGLRVALVEARDLSKTATLNLPSTEYSNRCSSLTPKSVQFLQSIGAWRHMQCERVQEYHEMQVWDGISDARIEFDWPQSSGPDRTVAFMTENLNLTSALYRRLQELGDVDIFDNTSISSIDFGKETEDGDFRDWPIVHLQGEKSLAARLLVGADGANSPVRTFSAIDSNGWDYERHGVVATLELEGSGWGGDFNKIAYQRFLPTGPIAMLPLPGKYSTLVWTTLPEHALLLKKLPAEEFVAMVNAGFRLSTVDLAYMHTIPSGQKEEYDWRMQHTEMVAESVPQTVVSVQDSSVASFPLKFRHADTYITERVALVGDAAHTIHPLAGQGLNQGRGDVQSLAKAIEYSVDHGQDIGALLSLNSYCRDRYYANRMLLGVCDKLHKLYSVKRGPLVPLRSLGLSAVNALSPLKRFFMEQASGKGVKIL